MPRYITEDRYASGRINVIDELILHCKNKIAKLKETPKREGKDLHAITSNCIVSGRLHALTELIQELEDKKLNTIAADINSPPSSESLQSE